ncbi:MAG: DinB family protein [Chloroflexota bacterium]
MATVKHPHLQRRLIDITQINKATQALFTTLSSTQRLWKPTPKEWSVAECFEHLVVTGELYYPPIRAAIEQAHRHGLHSEAPCRPTPFGILFIGLLRPGTPAKMQTTPLFVPTSGGDSEIDQRFLKQQEELNMLIQQAEGCDLNKVKVTSPAARMISFTLGEALWLQTIHQQLHLEQAHNICQMDGFPQT